MRNDYYVYVYIDPRNFQEFYYGKGKGSRKTAHLSSAGNSAKAKRIREIRSAGLDPIIRVIAANLTEHEAFLIEKTLIWKLGHTLTNESTGHFAEKFRPHFTLNRDLPGFDFQTGIYYYNVGECGHRNWDDYKEYGFISAGGAPHWRDQILRFNKGDIFAAYLKGRGFVGIGRIAARARRIDRVSVKGKPILSLPLKCRGMRHDSGSDELAEHVAKVKWIASEDRDNAHWKRKTGLYTTTHVRASLANQEVTLRFLEDRFGICLTKLLR